MYKIRLRRFLSVRGNRQLILSFASVVALSSVVMSGHSFVEARNARLYAEEHAVELSQMNQTRSELQIQVDHRRNHALQRRLQLVSVTGADHFRDAVIGLIRNAGCHLRSVSPGDHESRRWMEDDHLDADDMMFGDFDEEPVPSPFFLVSQSLNVQVAGDYKSIQTLVESVQNLNLAFKTRSFALQADSENGLLLDWDLQFFDLQPVSESDLRE